MSWREGISKKVSGFPGRFFTRQLPDGDAVDHGVLAGKEVPFHDRPEYLVAWSDQRNAAETCGAAACGTEIYFQRIAQAGTPIGSAVRVGRAPGRVVRHLDNGFAVEFSRVLAPDALKTSIA